MPSSHLILCHPLFLLPPVPPSIRVFSNESALCMRWPKYWSFSFSIIPSKEIPGLISFRMDWLDLLAVQGTLRSLLQLHSSEPTGRLSPDACVRVCRLSPEVISSSAASWTVACQAPLSMELSRQEYWGELPFPTPGNL